MTTQPIADLETLKARIKETWMTGDYSRIAEVTQSAADEFIARVMPAAGQRVLDIACGSGNLALPAARRGATVTGIDIAPNLLDQARSRAARDGLDITFDEGDAAQLPYPDGSFDQIVSMFGIMFVPQTDLVVRELLRVCRPGGQIALANWTPAGFVGQLFKTTGGHVPPPPGVASPLLWGDEPTVRSRLSDGIGGIHCASRMAILAFKFSVPETVEYYREYYGPTQKAFASLANDKQSALRGELEALYRQHNKASDGTTRIEAEYLEFRATRT